MTGRRACAVLAACMLLPPWALASELVFSVSLDDQPIGEHRFRITGAADARTVESEANFSVKLLGLTVYRYRHQAIEQWRGHCLSALSANTDDGGKTSRVQAQARGDALEVVSPRGTASLPGCVMGFAYWSTAIRGQSQLLNAQTGQYESVQLHHAGREAIDVRGQPLSAERWRIEGTEHPVDIWTLPNGDWVGLDSTVAGGRRLRYRLR